MSNAGSNTQSPTWTSSELLVVGAGGIDATALRKPMGCDMVIFNFPECVKGFVGGNIELMKQFLRSASDLIHARGVIEMKTVAGVNLKVLAESVSSLVLFKVERFCMEDYPGYVIIDNEDKLLAPGAGSSTLYFCKVESLPSKKKRNWVGMVAFGFPGVSMTLKNIIIQPEPRFPWGLARRGVFGASILHDLMKATLMIRRLKKDVPSQLPGKRGQQVFLDLAEKDMKQINALFRELEVIKQKIKACKSKEDFESLKFSEKNLINKIYTVSAEAKIPAVLDYLATVIEAGCKFLIFAHHQSMIDSIHQLLLLKKVGCIRIDGSTPPPSRQALVTDFQEKDSIKAAVLSIKAGGVGSTLTAASTVIFAELSWTPDDLIQAEDCAHRICQIVILTN